MQKRKKALGAMKLLWSVRERNFKGDFKIQMMIFEVLMRNIIFYGVEIWGVRNNRKFRECTKEILCI